MGKTAIAEGHSCASSRKGSRVLFNKRVVTLTWSAGTAPRPFEERMKAVMNELEKSPDVILFIDELTIVVPAASARSMLPTCSLAPGDSMHRRYTLDEYRQYIEKDGAFGPSFPDDGGPHLTPGGNHRNPAQHQG
jgi:ATP-dependent Clp protease ATP-binding subunit ClpC